MEGLVRFDPARETFEIFKEADGLLSNTIKAMLPDDAGNIWISHPFGLSKFDPENETFTTFTAADGIMEEGLNKGSYHKDEEGFLYFGGTTGLLCFDPQTIRKSKYVPPIRFTNLRIANKEVIPSPENPFLKRPPHLKDTLELTYKENAFFIEWTALDYRNPQGIEYAYFLEGFNEEWQYIGNEHKATFTNLSPDTYFLKVRSTNSDGVWAEQDKTLTLIITPPWWKTWWARLLFLVLFWGLMFGAYKLFLARRIDREEARRAKELEQIKARLYTNFTHEFRTPLTIINGLVEDLEIDPLTKEMLTRNSNDLLGLVNQVLDLAKMDAGQLQLDLARVEAIAFLNYLVESLQSMADRKEVRLYFEPETEALSMDLDRERFKSIILNLLSNAIKFTEPGGEVKLQAKVLQSGGKETLEVKVVDTGIGIPPEQAEHIFERFAQADAPQTQNTGGTGIGLSLARELAEWMGGTLTLANQPEKGATFILQLPVSRRATRETAEVIAPLQLEQDREEAPVSPEDAPQLLLVEDNPDLTHYISRMLGKQYRIHTAPDGEAGIQQALEQIPDLIITDVMMPKKNGFEVCATLKQDLRTSHIPIIILTAKSTQEDKIQGLTVGADAYLPKPFDKRELFLRIQNILRDRKRLQARYLSGASPAPDSDSEPGPNTEDQFVQK